MLAYLSLSSDSRIHVEFLPCRTSEQRQYAKRLAALVPGGRFMYGQKKYSYPLTVDNCRSMRAAWGDKVRVARDLSAWYRLEAKAAKEQLALSRAQDATLEVVPAQYPRLHRSMGNWQRVAAAWIANAYRQGGMLVDEPGIGKTRSVIAGLLERGSNHVLILCPKLSVKMVWGREWARLAPEVPVYLARGTRQNRERVLENFFKDPSRRKVLVTVAEMIRIKGHREKPSKPYVFQGYEYPELFQDVLDRPYPWDAVVVDESHTLLGSLTTRKANLAGEGLRLLPVEADQGLKLCVTGTPWGRGGRVQGMFGALHWCWPDEYSSYWQWVGKYFDVEDRMVRRGNPRMGTADLTVKVIGGFRDGVTEEDFLNSLGPRLLRRTMDEVKPGRIKPEYWELVCELEGRQLTDYRRLAADGELKVPGGILSTTGVLDTLTRARQMANGCLAMDPDNEGRVYFSGESNKLDVLMYELEQRGLMDGTGQGKVVIASQWVEFLNIISHRLAKAGVGHHVLTGKTASGKKDVIQDNWQKPFHPENNPERVLLLSSKAGGLSINLDAADEMFQCDRIYPPEAEEQLHRRIRRMSRDHPVRIYMLLSEGTVDEKTSKDLLATLMEQLRVLDGRRGLKVVRDIIRYVAPGD